VSSGLVLITVLLCVGSFNSTQIVLAQEKVWFCVPLFPLLAMFSISCLADTNRAPFDLPEAEAELVAGYDVEYSSMGFALFFSGFRGVRGHDCYEQSLLLVFFRGLAPAA
jgi:NADH:ubiquinone oxidoreductase subunit H